MILAPSATPPGFSASIRYDDATGRHVVTLQGPEGFGQSVVLDQGSVDALRQGLPGGPTLPLDDTTVSMVRLAKAHQAKAPQEPNGNMPTEVAATVAKTYAEWEATSAAWRLLIGARLYKAALDA